MMKKVVQFFVERSLIVNLISIGLVLAGLIFLATTNKEAFPNIDYPYVIVTTIYPGATAEDIEKHISISLEDQMREIEGIEELSSYSYESRSVIVIKLDPDLENKDRTVYDIRDSIDMVTDLPKDAEDPIVTELSTSLFPVLEISITRKLGISNDADERELRHHARMLEDLMQELNGVARVVRTGYRDREMIVEVNPYVLNDFQIGLNEIIGALRNKNINFPGGETRIGGEEGMIRTIGEVESAGDIRNILIRANDRGNWVRIGDVATVLDSFEDYTLINRTNGILSVTLTVLKKESADIIEVVTEIKAQIEAFNAQYGEQYEVTTSNDMSYYVSRRLNVLVVNGLVGLCLVFLSLFITLGWRISLVTAFGIPLAFAGTFVWMGQSGVTINLMSMFGLIIVLGMLVDDAIVVAENIYRHLEEGEPIKEAVINGTSEVIIPVAGTIMTTIAAFAPLMFMTGIMGKFMWTLPAVVSVALVASWLESMFILPSHVFDIEKRRKVSVSDEKKHKENRYKKIQEKYVKALRFVLTHKYKFSVLITAFFIFTVFMAGVGVKFKLFPQRGIERLIVKAEADSGTTLEQMSQRIKSIEGVIAKLPKGELINYITRVGIHREQPLDPEEKRGSNLATILINLTPSSQRERLAIDILDDIRNQSTKYHKEYVKVTYTFQKTGPPTGKAINVDIKGDDFAVLKKISKEYQDYLKKMDGIKDISDNFEENKKEARIYIKDRDASVAMISVLDIATTVRTCYEGTIASTIKKTDEEIDIRVRFPKKHRDRLDSLKLIKISNRMQNLVPLSEIAYVKNSVGIAGIARKGWKRCISVTADIDEKKKDITPVKVNAQLMRDFADISERFPGVIVGYEGEFRDTMESMENLGKSFLIAFVVIYIILVALFRSLHHPLVIMGVIPLTLVGVIWTFFFHDIIWRIFMRDTMPLSFLALMGVVGLAGVVVNDSIVFVDFIRKSRAEGLSPFDASLKAGGHRLRPIFLTTVTTFFGLIPTAYGIGGDDPFLKPMAISMSWGLAFGSFITLFATPILYNIFSDIRRKLFKGYKDGDKLIAPKHDEEITELEEKIKFDIEDDIREELKQRIEEDIIKDFEERNKVRQKKEKKTIKKKKK